MHFIWFLISLIIQVVIISATPGFWILALGPDTHACMQTHTHTDVCTEAILRNQVHPGLWLACTWFKHRHGFG